MLATTAAIAKTLSPELEQELSKVTEINSLPEIVTKIVQVVEDPRATVRDMRAIVGADPALAAKVLRVVNSAFYGLPAQVASLDRAVLLLGLNAVKNIALAASLARIFGVEALSEQFAARDLWRHCVAAGVCARLLADMGGGVPADEAFLAGLVHDIGLILVQQLHPAKLRQVIEQCLNQAQSFCAAEESAIGADHQAFGGALATNWKFPPRLCHAIACHHDVSPLPPQSEKITAVVYLADTLCSRARYGFWLAAQTQEIADTLLECVNLSCESVERVMRDLPARLEEAERIFEE